MYANVYRLISPKNASNPRVRRNLIEVYSLSIGMIETSFVNLLCYNLLNIRIFKSLLASYIDQCSF